MWIDTLTCKVMGITRPWHRFVDVERYNLACKVTKMDITRTWHSLMDADTLIVT